MIPTIALVVFRYVRERPANIPPVPFSDEARATIERAAHESAIRGEDPTTVDHLLSALLVDQLSPAAQILEQLGVDAGALRVRLVDGLSAPSRAPDARIPLYTNAARLVLERSTHEAVAAQQPEIRSVHLLAGLLHDRRSSAARMLTAGGVTLQHVRETGRALPLP